MPPASLQPYINGNRADVDPLDRWSRGLPVSVRVVNVPGVLHERFQPLMLDSPLVPTGASEYYVGQAHFTMGADKALLAAFPKGVRFTRLTVVNGQAFGFIDTP